MATTGHLERMLKRAFMEPGTRPRFLKKLLASNAFVFIQHPEGETPTVWNSQTVAWIRYDGAEVIPLFTSEEALSKAPMPGSSAYSVNVQSLLEANPNTHCHVNPGSTYDMQFSADDLTRALASVAQAGGSTRLMPGAAENAAIAKNHHLLTSKLMTCLAGISQVEKAYLLEADLSQLLTRPLRIAILASEDCRIAETISGAIEGAYKSKLPAEVRVFLKGSPEHLSMKAAGTAPFYDREWGPRLLTLEKDTPSQ
ncbi:SseB family protein [Frateuria sp. Soil773]|uniref:SseB family protein n=1 Tax=Frateuria sp. Soil773 TaxID=1736407 RepID=UPI000A8AE14E|nr:SseB family protein [Frateuria sp. Soil773]